MKSTKFLNLNLIIISTMLFINCNQPRQEDTTFDLENAKNEIASQLKVYEDAMIAGDAVTLGNLYTEDAEILSSEQPSTIGRQKIIEIFEGWAKDSVVGSFTTTGLWGNNDLLVEQGTGYFAHATGRWKSTGHYLLVWKNVDGQWQIFKDTWFTDPIIEE